MDILSPSARRRCNCVSAHLTIALLFFYLAALLLYYSIGIWIPQREPCFVNTSSIKYTEYENSEKFTPEKHFTLCYFLPDLTAKTPDTGRVVLALRQVDVTVEYSVRARDGTPDNKHSRDPPESENHTKA